MKAAAQVNYGAVEDQAAGGTFDEKTAYYLKETPLTPAERRRKFALVAVPIVAAILIMGGAALFLLRDFDTLYPGRHGGRSQQQPGIRTNHHSQSQEKTGPNPAPAPAESPAPPSNEKKSDSDVASSCLAHQKCEGLVGECCPTPDGVFLRCCN